MIDRLLLLSGNDIPFPEGRLTVHPPTIKEIAYIGEYKFFVGCGFLNFSKDLLKSADKVNLEKYNDFDIFMSMVLKEEKETKETIKNAFLVLSLMFPLYDIKVRNDAIIFQRGEEEGYINRNNFGYFKKILVDIFNLNLGADTIKEDFNPAGSLAEKIAQKFKKRHKK